jgi:hypothetical protein
VLARSPRPSHRSPRSRSGARGTSGSAAAPSLASGPATWLRWILFNPIRLARSLEVLEQTRPGLVASLADDPFHMGPQIYTLASGHWDHERLPGFRLIRRPHPAAPAALGNWGPPAQRGRHRDARSSWGAPSAGPSPSSRGPMWGPNFRGATQAGEAGEADDELPLH